MNFKLLERLNSHRGKGATENRMNTETENTKPTQERIEQRQKEYRAWRERFDAKSGPYEKRAKELASKFLREIEAEDYEAFAIIGIPNRVIESRFESHTQQCEHCREEYETGGFDLCDFGHDAMFEDDCYENVFVFKTRYAGNSGDYTGLAFDLAGDGRDGRFPFTSDLVDAAEPYRAETDHPQVTVHLDDGKRVQCDDGISNLILEMNVPGLTTHHSCQGTAEKENFQSAYVSFSGPLANQFAEGVLRVMLSGKYDELRMGIRFDGSDCCCGDIDGLTMRWHPGDSAHLLQFAKTTRHTLDAIRLRAADELQTVEMGGTDVTNRN
jgi:hypothetical protein